MEKTKIRMIFDDEINKEWKKDEEGYVDGYCRGADDIPYACVILAGKITMCPIHYLRVINIKDIVKAQLQPLENKVSELEQKLLKFQLCDCTLKQQPLKEANGFNKWGKKDSKILQDTLKNTPH